MYENDESLDKIEKYFGPLIATLAECNRKHIIIEEKQYLILGFVNGDLKLQCELDGHAGNATSFSCIEHEVTLAQLNKV